MNGIDYGSLSFVVLITGKIFKLWIQVIKNDKCFHGIIQGFQAWSPGDSVYMWESSSAHFWVKDFLSRFCNCYQILISILTLQFFSSVYSNFCLICSFSARSPICTFSRYVVWPLLHITVTPLVLGQLRLLFNLL